MTTLLEAIGQADQRLFLALNGWHTPWVDRIMDLVTFKFTWIPLYLFLIYSLVRKYQRRSIGMVLTLISAIALADQIASGLFKPFFARLRPCHDPDISSVVHVINGCGGQYGFVSSHAATAFALAVTFQVLTSSELKGAGWLYLWAIIYAFSRIYVGVHYPGDLVVGALVGCLAAAVCILIYKNVLQRKLS
ncbi:phosphatase PAP2 family protein [Telluribacter sp.]|jgi:undecaprenyl-diphosphatase|uniref:phosphatase PAP2 family protein n=1 Tax=Telluribacter sp. TaxID=1978767 RepID=UPI002E150B4A|nr:phosphatase PAP2 family protein [Telluribacter sp.]